MHDKNIFSGCFGTLQGLGTGSDTISISWHSIGLELVLDGLGVLEDAPEYARPTLTVLTRDLDG